MSSLSISSMPSDEEIAKLTTFPYNENNIIELKRNFCEDKLESTICALLNNGYGIGYIICGIDDNGIIWGVDRTKKEIDTYILRIDDIFHHNKIVTFNYETLKPHNIQVKILNCYLNKPLIIITIKSDININYQLLNGEIFYRINASNYKIKNIKLFTELDVKNKVEHVRSETIIQCQKLITNIQNTYIKQINELKMDRDINYNLLTKKIIQEKNAVKKQNTNLYCCSLLMLTF
jgi:hypothetical protein